MTRTTTAVRTRPMPTAEDIARAGVPVGLDGTPVVPPLSSLEADALIATAEAELAAAPEEFFPTPDEWHEADDLLVTSAS